MMIGGFNEEYPTTERAIRDNIHTLMRGPPKVATEGLVMKFDTTMSHPLQRTHIDPFVVIIKIVQMKVKHVLVDTGSAADLITMYCLK